MNFANFKNKYDYSGFDCINKSSEEIKNVNVNTQDTVIRHKFVQHKVVFIADRPLSHGTKLFKKD
jgi:hypothetical protein